MDRKHQNKLQLFRRVCDFGVAMQSEITPDSVTGRMFRDLAQVIRNMEAKDTMQSREQHNVRRLTRGKSAARQDLLDYLLVIYRASRVIAQTRPNVDDTFRPAARASDHAILVRARAVAAEAATLQAAFIEHEMPADFLTVLQAKITAMEQELDGRRNARSGQREATDGIDLEAAQGMKQLRSINDMVRVKFAGNTEVLRKWEIASQPVRNKRATGSGETEPATEEKTEAAKNAGA
ncbi:MAG: hypothetical protein ACKV2V_17365 [Blastocatellia bacterium]